MNCSFREGVHFRTKFIILHAIFRTQIFAKNGVNIFAKIIKFHENKKFREKRIENFLEPVSAIQLSFYRGFCGENRI